MDIVNQLPAEVVRDYVYPSYIEYLCARKLSIHKEIKTPKILKLRAWFSFDGAYEFPMIVETETDRPGWRRFYYFSDSDYCFYTQLDNNRIQLTVDIHYGQLDNIFDDGLKTELSLMFPDVETMVVIASRYSQTTIKPCILRKLLCAFAEELQL